MTKCNHPFQYRQFIGGHSYFYIGCIKCEAVWEADCEEDEI